MLYTSGQEEIKADGREYLHDPFQRFTNPSLTAQDLGEEEI